MSLRVPLFSSAVLAAALSVQAATVTVVDFNPTYDEKVAASNREPPKSEAQKTAEAARDVANQAGARTQIPGEGLIKGGVGLFKKAKNAIDTSKGSRVLLAERVNAAYNAATDADVVVGFGTAEQLAPVLAGLQSTNVNGNITFFRVDDTKKGPVANDFKALHEQFAAAGTPLVLVYSTNGTDVTLSMSAGEFKSDAALKEFDGKINPAPAAAAPGAAPAVTPAAPAAPAAPAPATPAAAKEAVDRGSARARQAVPAAPALPIPGPK